MSKPYLIVITGRPGSGKTTLAKELSQAFHMPLISRDQIKEGYVQTQGKSHGELSQEVNGIVSKIFFETVENLLSQGVSVVIEAAFQHRIWEFNLMKLKGLAQLNLLICKVDDELAHERYLQRGLKDESRVYFHGDDGIELARQGMEIEIRPYDEPKLDIPTYHIDTTSAERQPSIEQLKEIILEKL